MNNPLNKNSPILELRNISKSYIQGDTSLSILNNINLSLLESEASALMGSSGAGKSTLLHIAGLLDEKILGKIFIKDQSVETFSIDQKAKLRAQNIGFVYQFHHLLPEFTALENIILPMLLAGRTEKVALSSASKLLKMLKLEHRSHHRPSQLSGGEQQRIAILRALANRPKIILADEPTGNLDETTALHVFRELIDLIKDQKITALIATHNSLLAQQLNHNYILKEGFLTHQ